MIRHAIGPPAALLCVTLSDASGSLLDLLATWGLGYE